MILCFLHAYLKVRDRATKAMTPSFKAAAEKIWGAYGAPNKRAFAQRLRRLREWGKDALPESAMKEHVLDLCDKRDPFSVSDGHEQAHRTRNMVDRLMRYLEDGRILNLITQYLRRSVEAGGAIGSISKGSLWAVR